MFGFCNLPLHNFLLLPLRSFQHMMLAHAVCVNPITTEMLFDKFSYVCDMHHIIIYYYYLAGCAMFSHLPAPI